MLNNRGFGENEFEHYPEGMPNPNKIMKRGIIDRLLGKKPDSGTAPENKTDLDNEPKKNR